MLIRFLAKNLFSFKEETEFNLFTNKTQRLSHHKITHQDIDFLRFGVIYGANGSGKSNLIKAVALLEEMVEQGILVSGADDLKFKLDVSNFQEPTSLGIEFLAKGKVFYYAITFSDGIILNEYLAESNKEKDLLIFERNNDQGLQRIQFFENYTKDEKNKLFVDVLAEKLLQKNELLISFLYHKYPEEFQQVTQAYQWFDETLVIITPDAKPGGIAHLLDENTGLKAFADALIPTLNTGIEKLTIVKKRFDEYRDVYDSAQVRRLIEELKKKPNAFSFLHHSKTGEEVSLVYENNELLIKSIAAGHTDNRGQKVDFSISIESDGTKRLIDYLPALNGIINEDKVYLIDEIERSIHPNTIKEIITKISLDENAKGQLLFTTHESCLLDQDILRPDEIWFAQKAVDGSSRLYPLSDFNIHHTANIENGYLNGRFGGIPFLSNLKDLNWHKYEVSE